jgi:hypothetical protein
MRDDEHGILEASLESLLEKGFRYNYPYLEKRKHLPSPLEMLLPSYLNHS